jgi:fructosamine-3-kinase
VSGPPEAIAGRAVARVRPTAGGDINDAWALDLEDGGRAFVKTRAGAPPGEFPAEAAGLRWLGEPGALRVPEVLEANDGFLALAWIDEGRLDPAGEEELGRGLAAVHAAGAPAFGAGPTHTERPALPPRRGYEGRSLSGSGPAPLRLGTLELPNDPLPTWTEFYAERRLRPTARVARDRDALSADGVEAVERVCARIDDLAGPPEPPARLHGDLWGGNVLADTAGRPWLIDPAAYGGHREMDLAMLQLFGGASARALAAYAEATPLAAGHEDRVELWQLFPLLVHTALFGGGYGARAERAARRYAG